MARDKNNRGLQKERTGIVASTAMSKTVVVKVVTRKRNNMYGKYVQRTAKCYAHDEKQQCKVGDTVTIAEIRPVSKLKRWTLVKINESVSEAA